ncbi:hypothetical protein [Hymenobacter elongatus]|uniref:Uncharacterized protein n=1 Tax=Hymenobacter elongatus TaxID=877208 RepID=A0A4Z0PQF3_9BACT|nr:hypothetical protein [Hymenobacter elongatus]TGE19745.1 hypothetical protein E5J99_03010 [Hymenobacter elongatus]
MKTEKLLTVESSFVLTGLGVFVRGDDRGQALRQFGPHTTLAVRLVFADGQQAATTASVEEITRAAPADAPAPPAEYALLLQLPHAPPLPPGTEVWLASSAPGQD